MGPLPYIPDVWACVPSSNVINYIGIIIMERRGRQYSVTECRRDVGLSVRCFRLQSSKIDLRRSMIDVSTFENRRSMCRPSKIDGVVSTFEDR